MAKRPKEYLESIIKIFYEYGVRGLTMDQLASKIGLTKRTLYNNFGTKEELLKAILDHDYHNSRDSILHIASNPKTNAISIYIEVINLINISKDNSSVLFLQSLRESYPLLYDYTRVESLRLINEFFALNIPRGRSEGLYRSDFNIDILASFIYGAIYHFAAYNLGETQTAEELCKRKKEIMTMLLRGVVTEIGQRILEQEFRRVR